MDSRREGSGGAGEYLHGFIEEASKSVQITLVVSAKSRSSFANYSVKLVEMSSAESNEWNHLFRETDIFYDPQNGLSPKFLPPLTPVACSIYDLQHKVCPNFFSTAMIDARNKSYGFALERTDLALAISENEKRNFEEYWGVETAKTVYLAPYLNVYYDEQVQQQMLESEEIPSSDYAIFPAIAWPHKNHFQLLEGWQLLRDYFGDKACPKLILTGAHHSLSQQRLIEQKIERAQLSELVEIRGFVDASKLAALLKNAAALVFPSRYEGFGIPVVEALEWGVPVICSAEHALAEVGQDIVSKFTDPGDGKAIGEDLIEFWQDPLRQRRGEEGRKVAKNFSIKKNAEQTLMHFKNTIEDINNQFNRRFKIASPDASNSSNVSLTQVLIVDSDPERAIEAYLSIAPYPVNVIGVFSDAVSAVPRKLAIQKLRDANGINYTETFHFSRQVAESSTAPKENPSLSLALRCSLSGFLATPYFQVVDLDSPYETSSRDLRNTIALLRFTQLQWAELSNNPDMPPRGEVNTTGHHQPQVHELMLDISRQPSNFLDRLIVKSELAKKLGNEGLVRFSETLLRVPHFRMPQSQRKKK